ncbi:unannotated protein [freshwater metagenome]|uniref:Unannotated protein n=1 Tax=freshwater metagenome TaxID=449393 RepID=A0A6J7PWM2_9ZZZZ
MRGNLSIPNTFTLPYAALSFARVSSKPSTAHGPYEVHTTLLRIPKIPSRFRPCGFTRRCESKWSRRYASLTFAGALSKSISILTSSFETPRIASMPTSACRSDGTAERPPRVGSGNHVSRTTPPAIVAIPWPDACILISQA